MSPFRASTLCGLAGIAGYTICSLAYWSGLLNWLTLSIVIISTYFSLALIAVGAPGFIIFGAATALSRVNKWVKTDG